MEKNRQTVCVLDEQDTVIGYTYPNRAKGLIKKRRAEFVSDNAIRLYRQCPTYENMEDIEIYSQPLYFFNGLMYPRFRRKRNPVSNSLLDAVIPLSENRICNWQTSSLRSFSPPFSQNTK